MRALATMGLAMGCVAAGATTITQTRITAADGKHLATGMITITATAAFVAADGARVETVPMVVRLVNGGFSVALEPNDTGVPSGTQYRAVWALDGAKGRTDWWQVPTSTAALAVKDVVVNTIASPAQIIQWQQLGQGGAAVGQAPIWNGSSWAPGNVVGVGGGGGGYSRSFDSATTVTMLGTEHKLGTANLLVGCYDGTGMRVGTNTVSVDPATFDVVVTFAVAQSGRCVISGGGGGAGGANYVATVNVTPYAAGTVTLTNGSDQVAGNGTAWTSDMTDSPTASWIIWVAGVWKRFSYVSGTQGQLWANFTGTSGTYTYSLVPTTIIPGAVHGLGTRNVGVQCFDAGPGAGNVTPAQVARYPNYEVEIFWSGAMAGTCLLFR